MIYTRVLTHHLHPHLLCPRSTLYRVQHWKSKNMFNVISDNLIAVDVKLLPSGM